MSFAFDYKARDKQGRILMGTLEADSQATVVAKLQQMGYIVLNISQKKGAKAATSVLKLGGRKVKTKDLTIFSRQFATMINAGLSLTKCLAILSEQTESPALAAIIKEVQQDIEGGKALSESLAKHPKTFSFFFINMVKAGETGGVLDSVLMRIAEHYERESELKRRIKSAMAYPMAMFGLILAMAFAMIIFVVPIFAKMFEQFGSELPGSTQMLVNLSNFIQTKWYILLAIVAGFVYLFRRYKATEAGQLNIDKIKLKLPVVGILSRKLAVSRFSRTLGTLVSSGVPILQALDITADTAGNAVVAQAVRQTRTSIKEGETIARPLSASGVFPPMVVQMVAVGEETGALDTMLQKVADFYEAEVSATVEALTSMIEPLMIAFMGLIVGGMLVALYMPMFSIITEMGGT